MKTILVNFVQVLKTVKITHPAAAFVVAAAVTGVDAAAAAVVAG